MAKAEQAGFPYRRIVDDVRQDVLSARRAPGEKLPSEHEFAEQYGISRPTVRRAIAVLKAEGLVVSEQGRGAFVRPTPHVRLLVSGSNYRRHRRAGLAGFNAQAIEQGQTPGQEILEVAVRAAPAEISMRLNLDEGAPVVVRRRLFRLDGQRRAPRRGDRRPAHLRRPRRTRLRLGLVPHMTAQQSQLHLRPVSLREANRFVADHHRHHGPVRGHKFAIGVQDQHGVVRCGTAWRSMAVSGSASRLNHMYRVGLVEPSVCRVSSSDSGPVNLSAITVARS